MFWPKELARGILKMWLATLLLGVSLWVMYAIDTGDLLLSSITDSSDIGIDILKTVSGSLPFIGYIADAFDISANFTTGGGYGVLHDFSKSLLLFLIVHFSFGFIKGACDLLGKGLSPRTPYGLIFKGLFDIGFGMVVCISSMILMCCLHDITLNWWLSTFGNGCLSNWCYLCVLLMLIAAVFIMPPIAGSKSLLDSLGIMLTDFGLSLCVVTLGFSLLMVARSSPGSSTETLKAIALPYIACGAGLIILLRIRFRNT